MTPASPSSNDTQFPENQPSGPGGSGGGRWLVLLLGGLVVALLGGYFWATSGGRSGAAGPVAGPVAAPEAVVPVIDSSAVQPAAAPLPEAPEGVVPEKKTTAEVPAATAVAKQPAAAAASPAAAEAPAPAAAPVAPAAPAVAATQILHGRVSDENGQPLAGATVLLRGAGRGTSTDAEGNYSLEVPDGTSTILFGYGGYVDEEAEIKGGKSLDVVLAPNPSSGKRKRK